MYLKLPDVYFKHTGTPKGRGVFALRSFNVDEIVELCPVVVLETLRADLRQELQDIVFHWTYRPDGSGTSAVVLGYGSLYNHNNPANMRHEPDVPALTIRFIAVSNISKDEELTINYSGDGSATAVHDWWFEEKNMKPIIT